MRGSGWMLALVVGITVGCKEAGGGSKCRTAMILIPAGEFSMGCGDGRVCQADEAPVHRVVVPAFEMDSCEVTVSEFGECVQAGACSTPSTYSPQCNWGKRGKDSHPINCVTHEQAREYCAWAGKRLCTEAEWEKAARGGCELYADCDMDTPLWPWGTARPSCDRAVYGPCSCRGTCEVGTRPDGASPYGVLDLAGNVWEWVADSYHDTYDAAPANGGAWEDGKDRVFRGGGFLSPEDALRATNRTSMNPADATDALGIRCCRTLGSPGPALDAITPSDLPPEPGPHTDSQIRWD